MKYLYLLLPIIFIGCVEPEPQQEVKIVYKTIEVPKIVSCKSPDIDCDFSGENFIPTKKLLQCVIEQKRALEVCK